MSADLRSLEVFVAVAETLHFAKAAEHLHMQPSAVTEAIKRLEHEVGVVLLERTTRRVTLTDAGRSYLGDAKAILTRFGAAAERARHVESGMRGTLRMGVTLHPAWTAADRMAERAAATMPEVSIVPSSHFTMDQARLLEADELDLGIGIEPPRIEEFGRLRMALLPWSVVMPADHVLAARPEVALADLGGHDVAYVGASTQKRVFALIDGAFRAAGVRPARTLDAPGDTALVHAVVDRRCVGIGLRCWGDTLPAGLVVRPIAAPGIPPVELALSWVLDRQGPLITMLVELAESMAASGGFADLDAGDSLDITAHCSDIASFSSSPRGVPL
ncbi:MAG TPA: LysR family transcriptional regulator [Acidimicrobiales bacterium]|nr:LysR family transcriptional regulator [Acidimicrobiales bacterium]